MLQPVALSTTVDTRFIPSSSTSLEWSTSALYWLHNISGHVCSNWQFVCWNAAPLHIKFFVWLLVNDKLHTKDNLLWKTLVDNATCEICTAGIEDANNLFFGCSFVRSFWRVLVISFNTHWLLRLCPAYNTPHEFRRPATTPSNCFVCGIFGIISMKSFSGCVSHRYIVSSNHALKMQLYGRKECYLEIDMWSLPTNLCSLCPFILNRKTLQKWIQVR